MELALLRLAIALYLAGTIAALVGIAVRQELPRTLLPQLLWIITEVHSRGQQLDIETGYRFRFDSFVAVGALLILQVFLRLHGDACK